MADNNSDRLSITAERVIEIALRKVGIVRDTVPKVYKRHQDAAFEELNILIKSFRTRGLMLWQQKTLMLQPKYQQRSYMFGFNKTANPNTTQLLHTPFYKVIYNTTVTSIPADVRDLNVYGDQEVIGSTSLVEEHTTQALIQTDSGTPAIHVVTSVSGANFDEMRLRTNTSTPWPTETEIGDPVTLLNTESDVPITIDRAWRREYMQNRTYRDFELDVESRDLYQDQSTKLQDGTIQFINYQRNVDTGTLFLWPPPQDDKTHVFMTATYNVYTLDNLQSQMNFPSEWYMTLVYGLAAILADNYPQQVDSIKAAKLNRKARELLEEVSSLDEEMGSLFLEPDFRGGWR